MNANQRHNPQSASVQCKVKIQLQIAVRTNESISSERSHVERLELQRQVDYAWCAGFFDGEGCITLARVRRTCGHGVNYRTRVYIGQNSLETLHILKLPL